ncbi:MAG: YafY family transcriptional regulator [Sphingobacteriales bacterium]|nr:MAG: YafY family transcriptional regulator [Sphingobacteriales bacterium]
MNNDIKRISRLTAIITYLQTKRLLTAAQLAKKFQVSVRTIYRDIKVLEQAGVPILTEEGKGYLLMEGYSIPPVMFTEGEANALITAEQLILKSSDSSFRKEYMEAIEKIRAVLRYATKEKAALLASRIAVSPAISGLPQSSSLTLIQHALTSFQALLITYCSLQHEKTERKIEPFALYYSLEESWLLIAFCRLRKDFRMFRLDRICKIELLDLFFEPHKLTLPEYLNRKQKNFTTPDS